MRVKAFTLIELVVVMIIMGIMLLMTFRFGGNFVKDTALRQQRDELLADFSLAVGHTMGSRYVEGSQPYDRLQITIDEQQVEYAFVDSADQIVAQQSRTYDLLISGLSPQPLVVDLVPYILGCQIQGAGSGVQAAMTLSSRSSSHSYCYTLHPSTCKRLLAATDDECD